MSVKLRAPVPQQLTARKVSRKFCGRDKNFHRDLLPEYVQSVNLKLSRLARDRIVGQPVTTTYIVRRPSERHAEPTRDERMVECLSV
jgi:hypothetical protein